MRKPKAIMGRLKILEQEQVTSGLVQGCAEHSKYEYLKLDGIAESVSLTLAWGVTWLSVEHPVKEIESRTTSH